MYRDGWHYQYWTVLDGLGWSLMDLTVFDGFERCLKVLESIGQCRIVLGSLGLSLGWFWTVLNWLPETCLVLDDYGQFCTFLDNIGQLNCGQSFHHSVIFLTLVQSQDPINWKTYNSTKFFSLTWHISDQQKSIRKRFDNLITVVTRKFKGI